MNYNNKDNMWSCQVQDYSVEDDTIDLGISECLLNDVNQNEDHHMSYMLDDGTTPIKACNLTYYAPSTCGGKVKEVDEYREHPSQAKRRRMLQFESEILDTPLCSDEAFLRSKETADSLEDAISEMSQWVSGFTDDMSVSTNECLDPSSEMWINDCLNDPDYPLISSSEDMSSASGASDIQIDISDLCNTPEYDDTYSVNTHPVQTRRNVVFRGKKSYMCAPPKRASSVIYPFTFVKPCGGHGDVTINDINKRIHTPTKPKEIEDPTSYPTSAFSGKPVVVKTKIHTDGGKGSITIMRTKG